MKSLSAILIAMAALPGALILAKPAAASDDVVYYWHDDCKGSPGNNLECVRLKVVMKYLSGGHNDDMDVDRITLSIQDGNWCGAKRVSGGTGWGIGPFIITTTNGHTGQGGITRWYVVPAGCAYHLHGRGTGLWKGTAAHTMSAGWTNSHNCVEFNLKDEDVWEIDCPGTWPDDRNSSGVPMD